MLTDPSGLVVGRAASSAAEVDAAYEADSGTRERVSREILQHGPITASDLGATLGLTPAAVRRHLDILVAHGLVTTISAPESSPRRRGRPARRFVLTDAGHAAMSTAYDDLAAQLLDFVAATAGPDAVAEFAAVRAERLAGRYRAAVDAVGSDPHQRAAALAGALSTDGYAASVRSLDEGGAEAGGAEKQPGQPGKQLCQGHCPVQHVATRFPQLCEAETRAFSDLLGVHVQRLATLAHGEHVCTTHVPAGHLARPPAARTAPPAPPGTPRKPGSPHHGTIPEPLSSRGEVSR
jgi:predicted ArsR family transcriptional regulator